MVIGVVLFAGSAIKPFRVIGGVVPSNADISRAIDSHASTVVATTNTRLGRGSATCAAAVAMLLWFGLFILFLNEQSRESTPVVVTLAKSSGSVSGARSLPARVSSLSRVAIPVLDLG